MIDQDKKNAESKRSKTYFYCRHYQSFYTDPEKALILSGTTREEITKGQLMIYLYERMLTLSIKTEGFLRFSDKIPFTPKILGKLFNLEESLVEEAVLLFEEYGLVQIVHNKKKPKVDGTIFMTELPDLIASITAETKSKSESNSRELFEKKKKVYFDDVEEAPEFDPNLEIEDVDSLPATPKEPKAEQTAKQYANEQDRAFDNAMRGLKF